MSGVAAPFSEDLYVLPVSAQTLCRSPGASSLQRRAQPLACFSKWKQVALPHEEGQLAIRRGQWVHFCAISFLPKGDRAQPGGQLPTCSHAAQRHQPPLRHSGQHHGHAVPTLQATCPREDGNSTSLRPRRRSPTRRLAWAPRTGPGRRRPAGRGLGGRHGGEHPRPGNCHVSAE